MFLLLDSQSPVHFMQNFLNEIINILLLHVLVRIKIKWTEVLSGGLDSAVVAPYKLESVVMSDNLHWQRVGMNKVKSQLRFDIEGFSDFCPNVFKSTDTKDMSTAKLKELHKPQLDSELYKIRLGELITEWQMVVKFWGGQQYQQQFPSLSVFLKFIKSNGASIKPGSIEAPVKAQCDADLLGKDGTTSVHAARSSKVYEFRSCHIGWGFENVDYLYHIWENENRFLIDNTLRIRIDLTIITNGVWRNEKEQPLMTELSQDFSKLLASGDGSDVVINCGPKTFNVHRTILLGRSPVFANMFRSGLSEAKSNTIVIEDIEPDVLKLLLTYIYSATLDIKLLNLTEEELVGLVQASDKYQVDDLKQFCIHRLLCNVSLANAGKIAVLIHLHSTETEDKDIVFQYCSRNWQQLAENPEFQELVKGYPAAFVPAFPVLSLKPAPAIDANVNKV